MHIIIVGCGRVGGELANILSAEGHNVVVVDKKQEAFSRLGHGFNGMTLTGNGFDVELLKEAGIEKAEALCAVSDDDNTNIMASQVAKRMFQVPRVIARVYDPHKADVYDKLGLDIISGTLLVAAMIRDKLMERSLTTFLVESGEVGVMEIEVGEKLAGKRVEEVNIPGELLVSVVMKPTGAVLPGPDDILCKGERIFAIVKMSDLKKIKEKVGM